MGGLRPSYLKLTIMGEGAVKIFLRDMTVTYFIVMTACMMAGIAIFIIRRIIMNLRATIKPTLKQRKNLRIITILRTVIGIILIPFVIAYFPEISEFLFGIEGGTEIAPISALGSGMGIDRLIDQALTKGGTKKV